MTYDTELADRIRAALATELSVREVRMFGGLAFLVDGSMVVSASGDGGLLVRADPERAGELLAGTGASPAEMGAGRSMGPSWIAVTGEAVASDEGLASWMAVALAYHRKTGGRTPTG